MEAQAQLLASGIGGVARLLSVAAPAIYERRFCDRGKGQKRLGEAPEHGEAREREKGGGDSLCRRGSSKHGRGNCGFGEEFVRAPGTIGKRGKRGNGEGG